MGQIAISRNRWHADVRRALYFITKDQSISTICYFKQLAAETYVPIIQKLICTIYVPVTYTYSTT